MPSLADNEPLPLFQKDGENVSAGNFSPKSPLSPRSVQNFASESTRHEIVEAHMGNGTEEEEEDAAFCAEAEAFARKCDVHEFAVRRLVQDLVEDDELETSKEMGNPSAAMENSEVGSLSITKTPMRDTPEQENNPRTHTQNGKSVVVGAKQQENKRPGLAQTGKNSHHLDRSSSKKRIHPMRERAQEKASPKSPSKTHAATPLKPSKLPNPSLKTPLRKPSAEPNKISPNSTSASKRFTQEESETGASSETYKVQRRVKEFFQRRKSTIGFGNRRALGDNGSVMSSEHNSLLGRENPDLGPFLLKLAKQAITSGDKPQKALDFATRAAKSYEIAADGRPSLDLVTSLHVLAAIHCSLGQYDEAVMVLERSIAVPDIETGGQEHALAAFAGYMQLGDTFALLGKGEEALSAYQAGLEIQMGALGNKDPRVRETCRYSAEAHAQALQFDKAEELCQHALDIHKEHSAPASIEEATDRRLMGLICNGKGQHEAALEHLVLASMALVTNGTDAEVAAVDANIGDTYVSLGRLDEAAFAYQKALTVFKSSKGDCHVAVASVYVSLAELYLKTGKLRESRTFCESALRIYSKQGGGGHQLEEVASGLTEIAIIYEALDEHEQALSFLEKALAILEIAPGQQSAVAGVEAQIGVLNYLRGNYVDARAFFSKAVSKLRSSAEKNSSLFGIVLNQMGLSCVQLSDVQAAVDFFEESRSILEAECGPHHPDTLSVYSNLAGAYDALGRLDDAIAVLEYTLEAREDTSISADMEVEDEKTRLAELLKEAGRPRARRYSSALDPTMQVNTIPKSTGGQHATAPNALAFGQIS